MFLNSLGIIGEYCAKQGWDVYIQLELQDEYVTLVRKDGAEPESIEVKVCRDPDVQILECERATALWGCAIPRDQWEDAANYWE